MPNEAKRKYLKGSVKFTAIIGCDGYTKECQVIRSSGHAVLDEAACQDMFKRSRVKPATNSAGQLVESTFTQTFNYRYR